MKDRSEQFRRGIVFLPLEMFLYVFRGFFQGMHLVENINGFAHLLPVGSK